MRSCMLTMPDGKRIFTQIWDQQHDNTVIYVHGGPGTGCYEFQYQAEQLACHVNVVLFDQRGVLRSDPIGFDKHFGTALLIEDMEEIRKQLSISQWIPMGHSYGGQLALLYALQYPQRTAKLIYICPSFNLYISMKFVFEKSITLLSQKGQFQKALLLKQTMTRCTTAQDYVEQLAEIPREIREEVYYSKDWKAEIKASIASVKATEEQWRNGQKQQALLFQEGCLFEDYMLYLPKITVPSLLLVGEYDPICPPIQQKAFLQHAPAGMLATIPQAGHDAYNDNPEQFIKAVTQFI